MADTKLFAGPRIRRIRTGKGLTQTAMANELGISPSYLNLIERNQRPLTAQLVLKLVATYDVDAADLQPTGEGGAIAALKEVFGDQLLSGELPGDTELLELSDGAPNAAMGIVKLYQAYREQQERLSDLSKLLGGAEGTGEHRLPFDEVRATFEANPWCFPALENAAGRILEALGDERGLMGAMHHLLRADHGISVDVVPAEVMPNLKRRYDRHARRLFLSQRMSRAERAEWLAGELLSRREGAVLDEEVELLGVKGDEARRLARLELIRYAALAVVMPYERMVRLSERLRYDPLELAARFETGFSQVVQRLVALQDRSAGRRAGLPFFAMEVNRGGMLLRRIGAKGFPAAKFGGHCPKLAIHAAFARPGEVIAERVASPAGDVWFTLSMAQDGLAAEPGERPHRTAWLLGIEDAHAAAVLRASQGVEKRGTVLSADDAHVRRIAQASLLPDPIAQPPLAAGPACRVCERIECAARAAPLVTRPLGLDDLTQGFGPYGL